MGVEFQENNDRRDFAVNNTPKLAKWLIAKGMASDLATANKIQLVASLVFLVIAAVIFVLS